MKTFRISTSILVAIALFVPVSAMAQGFEITPFIGYQFGGDAYDYWSGTSVSLDDGSTYGLALDIPVGHFGDSFVEIYWSRHDSGARTYGFEPISLDLDVDVWQIGGMHEFPGYNPNVRPYVAATVGATSFRANAPWSGSDTFFSAGLGGGVKIMMSNHVGLRLDARGLANFVGTGGGSLGCGPNGCWFGFSNDVLWQFEASAGLTIAF
jgi:hypothetical protein